MASKNNSTKRKSGTTSTPTPLALYRRGLTAVKSWSPHTSETSDAEALAVLASCARQLQNRMGLPAGASTISNAIPTTTNGHGAANGTTANGAHADVPMTAAAATAAAEKPTVAQADGQGEGEMLAAVWPAVDALQAGMRSYGPTVRHSLDLDLEDWRDEPGFLLASCHMELGKLLGRMWPRQEGRELAHLRAAVTLFPGFVAGRTALAQALLARADHESDLREAEALLRGAARQADRLAAAGGGEWEADPEEGERDRREREREGETASTQSEPMQLDGGASAGGEGGEEGDGCSLLLEANAACRREWQAGAAARRSVAMLLCQEGRDGEAAPLLAALEYTHRLARKVLHYPLDPLLDPLLEPPSKQSEQQVDTEPTATTASDPKDAGAPAPAPAPATGADAYVRAVDGALPPQLLGALRGALQPGSRFWRVHGYGRVGYFSYMHELSSPPRSAVHQAASLLHALILPRFPAAAEARFAEWWAHCRRHPSGHQLHFDSDDEGAGGVRNPIVSAVIYLTGGVGGPTLVTPQLLGGPLAPHGWLVHPRESRLGVFDSTVLHGVIPGRGPSPQPGQHRITLMIAFWKDLQCRPRSDGLPGPSQPFPEPGSPAAARHTWLADLAPLPGDPASWGPTDPRDAPATAIDRVWERIDGGAAQPGTVSYDACFQGF